MEDDRRPDIDDVEISDVQREENMQGNVEILVGSTIAQLGNAAESGEHAIFPYSFGYETGISSIDDTYLVYSDYFKNLLTSLPEANWANTPRTDEEERVSREAVWVLREKLEIGKESSQLAHSALSKDDSHARHELYSTNIDSVFYHRLRLTMSAISGTSLNFFTTGYSRNELEHIFQKCGADDREVHSQMFEEVVERHREGERQKELRQKRERLKARYRKMSFPSFAKHATKTLLGK